MPTAKSSVQPGAFLQKGIAAAGLGIPYLGGIPRWMIFSTGCQRKRGGAPFILSEGKIYGGEESVFVILQRAHFSLHNCHWRFRDKDNDPIP